MLHGVTWTSMHTAILSDRAVSNIELGWKAANPLANLFDQF